MQASIYEFAEAGTPVLQVSATDVECANSSCIAYSLEPADYNSEFVIDSQTGSVNRSVIVVDFYAVLS